VVVARGRGWSLIQTARSAALAGVGHVTTTLILGAILWYAGSIAAANYAHIVSLVAAVALIAFGAWIAYGGWREATGNDHGHSHDHGHDHHGHAHVHYHEDGTEHVHWHEHHDGDFHADAGAGVMHHHDHAIAGRTALLLILGSSPMFEGIPAFLAASTRGPTLLGVMAIVFAISTIATYVFMCTLGVRGLAKTSLGPLEKYGEMLSGLIVAAVGVYQLFAP